MKRITERRGRQLNGERATLVSPTVRSASRPGSRSPRIRKIWVTRRKRPRGPEYFLLRQRLQLELTRSNSLRLLRSSLRLSTTQRSSTETSCALATILVCSQHLLKGISRVHLPSRSRSSSEHLRLLRRCRLPRDRLLVIT